MGVLRGGTGAAPPIVQDFLQRVYGVSSGQRLQQNSARHCYVTQQLQQRQVSKSLLYRVAY